MLKTVNQLLFLTSLFCDLLPINWFADTNVRDQAHASIYRVITIITTIRQRLVRCDKYSQRRSFCELLDAKMLVYSNQYLPNIAQF